MKKLLSLSILLAFQYAQSQVNITRFPNMDSLPVLHFCKQYLPENPVIIEAGTYTGEETLHMSYLWPQGTVHAFEPVPHVFKQMEQRTIDRPQVKRYQLALSDAVGTAQFYVSSYSSSPDVPGGSGSLLKPKEHLMYAPDVLFKSTINVPMTTIDAWAQENGVDHVDLMWLDMQGNELPAIKASPKILATVKVIYTEIEFVEAYEGQPLLKDIDDFLTKQGFVMVANDFGYCGWFGNGVYVRKELVKD